jgi:branched-chain amino acid transport system permease protein
MTGAATAVVGVLGADEWLLHTLIGLSFGLVLFLVASGFTLTFGLARFVNLAHGATFLVAAHVAFEVDDRVGSFPVTVAASVVAGVVVSLLVYGLASTRWRTVTGDVTQQVLFTFGCLLVLADQVRERWGGIPRSVPLPSGLDGSVAIAGATFPVYRLFVMGAAALVAVGIWLLQERTRFGSMVRAGVDATEQLEAMGVRPRLLYLAVFGLAGGLAGLAGGLGAPILGASVGQELDMLIFALVAVVVGGLGSLGGAFVASLLVGLVDAYAKAAFPTGASFTIMALVVVVLAVRPTGLFPSTASR